MENNYFSLLFSIFFLLSSFIYSAGEAALITLRTNNQSISGRLVESFFKSPQRFLILIIVGNNLASVYFAIFNEKKLVNFFNHFNFSENVSILMTILLITLIILVFGDVLPKTLGIYFPQILIKIASPFIWVSSKLFFIIVMPLDQFTRRVFSLKNRTHSLRLNKQEIRNIIKLYSADTIIDAEENIITEQFVDFMMSDIRKFIIPRQQLYSGQIGDSLAYLYQVMHLNKIRHLLIQGQDMDDLLGYVSIVDLYWIKDDSEILTNKSSLIYPLFYFASSKSPLEVFSLFQEHSYDVGIVVDEFGSTVGLMTRNLLTSCIAFDYFYISPNTSLEEDKEFGYSVDPRITSIRSIKDIFSIEEDWESDDETLGLFLVKLLDRFPEEGEEILYHGLKIKVAQIQDHVMYKVYIKKELN